MTLDPSITRAQVDAARQVDVTSQTADPEIDSSGQEGLDTIPNSQYDLTRTEKIIPPGTTSLTGLLAALNGPSTEPNQPISTSEAGFRADRAAMRAQIRSEVSNDPVPNIRNLPYHDIDITRRESTSKEDLPEKTAEEINRSTAEEIRSKQTLKQKLKRTNFFNPFRIQVNSK